MPLCWAHAEYIKLVRSATDGQVFDIIPEVADRYQDRRKTPPLEIWKFNRQVRSVSAGGTLRIQANSPFRLLWTHDRWDRTHTIDSTSLDTGHDYADIRLSHTQGAPIEFTFFWKAAGVWERRNFQVSIMVGESSGFGMPQRESDFHNEVPTPETELRAGIS